MGSRIMTLIDAHIHYGDPHPALQALLEEEDIQLLNICVAHDSFAGWQSQAERYKARAAEQPARFAWCTSFDLPRFDGSLLGADYVDSVIAQLDADIATGAVACKIWKNIGMEVRNPEGAFMMPDDPIFTPILEHLARRDLTLLTHIAEPIGCWLPLDPATPHYTYYRDNPEWHMYNRPEVPSHGRLMEARDRLVARHPNLRVVGAHMGSLEYDVDEVAVRLARYPNFAVDVSARLADLAWQAPDRVRGLFLNFPDRILFGTDVVQKGTLDELDKEARQAALEALRRRWHEYRAYFEGRGTVTVGGREVRALGLSGSVLERFYTTNAQNWYPGLCDPAR
jgi:hypothetical protein